MTIVLGHTYMKIPGLPGGLVSKEGLSNGGGFVRIGLVGGCKMNK